MGTFRVTRPYSPELDVRDRDDLLQRIESQPPNGVVWPLVAARRAGKTWTLRAIEHRFNELQPGAARFLDLRRPDAALGRQPSGDCLLLDEPGAELARDARAFLDRCTELYTAGTQIVLAMTPAEWVLLREAGEKAARISAKDLLFLPPLGPHEARKLARTRQARTLLKSLPPGWQRSPFLLELVFEMAEASPDLARDPRALVRAALDKCDDTEHFYFEAVFSNGLTKAQQAVVLGAARGARAESPEWTLLERCGLLSAEGERRCLADPVLDAHLRPLRIHHISDIHIGSEEASGGGRSEGGERAAPARESYIEHLRELEKQGRAPHIVVVSGDIADSGVSDQYDVAGSFLGRLKYHLADHPLLGPEDPRVLLVPGNHDVDFGLALRERARHRPFAAAFSGFPRPPLEVPPEERGLAKVAYADLGVEVLLLGSGEFGCEDEKDEDRADFIAVLESLRVRAASEGDAEAQAALRDRIARVHPGLVHGADLKRVKEAQWRQPVRIAVLHHPVSPLPGAEAGRLGGLINAGEVKDTLLQKGFCLVLHGHAHAGWFCREQWPGRYQERGLHIAAAPPLGSRDRRGPHGFNEIEVLRERRGRETHYEVSVIRYGHEGTWVKQASMGPFTPEE